jgi:hypothetical protein
MLFKGASARIGAQHVADDGFAAADPVMALLAIAAHNGCPVAIAILITVVVTIVAVAAITVIVPVAIPVSAAAIVIATANMERPVPAAPV